MLIRKNSKLSVANDNIAFLSSSLQNATTREELLKNTIVNSSKTNGFLIDRDLKIALSDTTLSIGKFINGNKKLVFYSPLDYCSSCVENELLRLNSVAEKYGHDQILVIFKKIEKRDAYLLYSSKKVKYAIASLDGGALNLPVSNDDLPIIFIINEDLKVSDYFIPYKNMDSLTDEFITSIITKTFKN